MAVIVKKGLFAGLLTKNISANASRNKISLLKLCPSCMVRLNYTSSAVPGLPVYYEEPDTRPSSPNVVFPHIQQVLASNSTLLKKLSHYHFNGLGKAVRPNIVMLTARAFNFDSHGIKSSLRRDQLVVAMVAEMIHTASLVHDDIIDNSEMRRGQPSVFSRWGQSQATYTGDYILSAASVALSQIRHNRVMHIMSQILENLVQGEFMQLGTKEKEDERFNHYIEKSYRKTASLIANSCKSSAVLSGASEQKIQLAFEFGRNLGIAFQLIDDLLDYVSNEEQMGKPVAADLKLGLATAPVLFASHEFPQLNSLILRRFSQPGDLEQALSLVRQSCGVEQTRTLATRYSKEAVSLIGKLRPSEERDELVHIACSLLDRRS